MSDNQRDIERAAAALNRALRPDVDAAPHPGYERLEAFVDGRLGEADTAQVERHIEMCEVCAQDVADLRGEQAALHNLAESAGPRRHPRTRRRAILIAAGTAAAAITVVIFTSPRDRTTSAPQPTAIARPPAAPSATTTTELSAEERERIARVMASGRLDLPEAVVALRRADGTLLGGNTASQPGRLLSPSGTGVLSPRPTFVWTIVPGATTYTVTVVGDDFTRVADSGAVTGTSWQPTIDLPRGVVLMWQVRARVGGQDVVMPAPPAAEARFMVIDAATAATLERRRTQLEDDPMTLGILLAGAGALDDAASELQRAATRAADSATARRLLADLQRRRIR